jgi:hypothetical protein
MPRLVVRRSADTATWWYALVGAAAGAVLGLIVAERTGGVDALARRLERRASAPPVPADGVDDSDWHEHDGDDDADLDDAAAYGALDVLEERVLEAFQNDPVLAHRAVDISAIAPDTVELTGWVRVPTDAPHAVTIARGVPGVRHVVDRLVVRRPAGRR